MRTIEEVRALANKVIPADEIKGLPKGGRQISYLSGEYIASALGEMFDYDGWSRRVTYQTEIHFEQLDPDMKKWTHIYVVTRVLLTIRIISEPYGIQTIEHEGTGVEPLVKLNRQGQVSNEPDMQIKASATDALKNAASWICDHLGLSLRDGSSIEEQRHRSRSEETDQQFSNKPTTQPRPKPEVASTVVPPVVRSQPGTTLDSNSLADDRQRDSIYKILKRQGLYDMDKTGTLVSVTGLTHTEAVNVIRVLQLPDKREALVKLGLQS